jgi:hypothetical protein
MTAVAVETRLAFERRLRAVPRETGASSRQTASLLEAVSERTGDIEPWELHSELVFVCPEVSARARQLLPERDPDAFLLMLPEPASRQPASVDAVAIAPNLPVAVVGYAFWRLAETARTGFIAVAAIVALTVLAEVLH